MNTNLQGQQDCRAYNHHALTQGKRHQRLNDRSILKATPTPAAPLRPFSVSLMPEFIHLHCDRGDNSVARTQPGDYARETALTPRGDRDLTPFETVVARGDVSEIA